MAVRRVRRVVRRIDPWTVLKVSMVFNAIAGLVFVLGVWVVWSLLLQRGVPDRIVEIFEAIRITITVDGELYFRIVVFMAVVGAIALTGLMTLSAVLYNLIADLVGGLELTVLEETYNVPEQPAGPQRVRPAVHRSETGNGSGTTTEQRQRTPRPSRRRKADVTPDEPAAPDVAPPVEAQPEEAQPEPVAEKTPTVVKSATDG